MADIAKEVLEMMERIKNRPRPLERHFYYPAVVVKQAEELYKNSDWYIHGHDGSLYYHGEQIRPPCKSVSVTALNEKIAAMELPTYPEHLQTLTPEQKNVYLTGEWGRAEEGDNHG